MEDTGIKQLVANGDTEAAIRQLLETLKGKAPEYEALLLAARFQKNQQGLRQGTSSEEDYRQELNRINLAVLQLADSLSDAPGAVPKIPAISTFRHWYWVLPALAMVILLVWYYALRRPAAVYQFQYKQQGIPSDVMTQIDSLQKAGQFIRDLSFGPAGEWAILYGRNRCVHNGDLPLELIKQMDTLQRIHDVEFKGLYLGANSEALLRFGRNFFWHTAYRDMPKNMVDSLYLYHAQNREIKDVGIATDNSWVILWNQNGYTWEGVHDSLAVFLHRTSMDYNLALKSITFSSDGGWVLLFDYNSYWWGFVDPGLPEALDEIRKNKKELLNVFMRRGNEWIVLYR